MKRIAAIGVSAILMLVGCGTEPGTTEPDDPVATAITVAPNNLSFDAIGATEELTATVNDQNGNTMSGATVTWSSSAVGVATVSNSGLVTSVGNGSTTIFAGVGGVSGSVPVTVTQAVGEVEVTPASAMFESLQETAQFTAVATDPNDHVVSGQVITWSSADEDVATVNGAGLVTAEANGTTTIAANADGASGIVAVTVAQVVSAVVVDPAVATLSSVGATIQLTAIASDAKGYAVFGATGDWSSSDFVAAFGVLRFRRP